MLVWLCVAVRILSNPFSNVLQKLLTRRHADPLFIVCVTHAQLALVCLPVCVPELPGLSAAFWGDMILCTLLAVLGNVLLVAAMQRADLSVLGPINAYKSVVSLAGAWLLLGEWPRGWSVAGIALIVVGSLGLADRGLDPSRRAAVRSLWANRGIQLRIAALILSAIEAVLFKRAMQQTTVPVAFAVWGVLGFVVCLPATALVLGRGRLRAEIVRLRENCPSYLLLFLTTSLMQLSTAVTLQQLPVGSTLALFQLSTLLSVILGHRLFQETDFLRRFLGALIMSAGAVLIVLSR